MNLDRTLIYVPVVRKRFLKCAYETGQIDDEDAHAHHCC